MSDDERCRAKIYDRRGFWQAVKERDEPKDLRCKRRAVTRGLCGQHAKMKAREMARGYREFAP